MYTKTKRERLYQFLETNPLVEERLMSIIDLSDNADGNSIILDDVEERLIIDMQKLGNGFLTAWANNRESKTTSESNAAKGHIRHSKKNSIS